MGHHRACERGCTMHRDTGARSGAAAVMLLGTMLLASGAAAIAGGAQSAAAAPDLQAERDSIDAWRAGRIGRLTSDTGGLTIPGLSWCRRGRNGFAPPSSNGLT